MNKHSNEFSLTRHHQLLQTSLGSPSIFFNHNLRETISNYSQFHAESEKTPPNSPYNYDHQLGIFFPHAGSEINDFLNYPLKISLQGKYSINLPLFFLFADSKLDQIVDKGENTGHLKSLGKAFVLIIIIIPNLNSYISENCSKFKY